MSVSFTLFAVLSIFCILCNNEVAGKLISSTVFDAVDQSSEEIDVYRSRTKHVEKPIIYYIITMGLPAAIDSAINAFKCSEKAGCHRGYCWAWCGVSLSKGEWCYTTRSFSQSDEYVTCKDDYDCEKCWKCGGLCTL